MRYLYVIVIVLLAGCVNLPTTAETGVSFSTVQSEPPANSTCLNPKGEAGLAKELINARERLVVIGGGANPISDEDWADFAPRLPWQKNVNRHTMFSDHCFYRSPAAPADCEGDACAITRTYQDHTWIELSAVHGIDCFPTPDAGCGSNSVDPGAFSIAVTEKCHQLIFEDEIYELVDDRGNHFVMHATAAGAPDTENVALPPGWTLTRVELDEPLEILPFGGGDGCFHNVGRDNLGQGYHQYIFADAVYP